MGRTLSAFDFAQTRSRRDAELLYEAKYGERENGKMSRKQARGGCRAAAVQMHERLGGADEPHAGGTQGPDCTGPPAAAHPLLCPPVPPPRLPQYQALRRKIGGTAKDYWKGWVDVKGDYIDRGYVAKDNSATSSSVSALPFLLGIVFAMLGATAFVVSATS